MRRRAKGHPEFDFNGAREGRDEGTGRAVDNEGQSWKEAYWRLMRATPPLGSEFSGEAFRVYATPLIGPPHTHKVWGGMWIKGGADQKSHRHRKLYLDADP